MSSLSTPASHPADQAGAMPLLVLVDPAASRVDGESVRIARDVLGGGADCKVALPRSGSELDRIVAHRGRRRPVVIGSDVAVQRVVQTLLRQRELGAEPLGVVPVGPPGTTEALRGLGVPGEPVAAARSVLGGRARKLDLLVDDAGGVVLSRVRILLGPRASGAGAWRSLWAKLAAAEQGTEEQPEAPKSRALRIAADDQVLVELHQKVRALRAALSGGELEVILGVDGGEHFHRAASLTVEGGGFGYEADGCPAGPVRARTWTVHSEAWGLILPGG